MADSRSAETRMVLVRHGESVATQEQYIAGYRTCKGLTELGRTQAQALAERLQRTGEIKADVLIASNFPRAIETAEIIAPALGGLEVVEHSGVGEHDPGPICDGMTFDEFVERFGDDRNWEDPYHDNMTGGETISAFHFRVATALHDIAREHRGTTIMVVCHGGVVDVAFRSFLRMPMTGSFDLHTLNTSLTEFARVSATRWRLERYNDIAHLGLVGPD
jgi:probable phosphoglycerate mutase